MSARPRVGYLGPAGTFSEEALLGSVEPGSAGPVAFASLYETAQAVREGAVQWALLPIENSLDGSISVTLDLLAQEEGPLQIVGEVLLAVRHALIAKTPVALEEIDTVISHPKVPGQCTRFLRAELPHARILPASSTAEAVRAVATDAAEGTAALGTTLAAELYGASVIRAGVQDRDDNETRFVWIARAGAPQAPPLRAAPAADAQGSPEADAQRAREAGAEGSRDADAEGSPEAGAPPPFKTSLVFWGAGADSPGWLVRCLDEFARRGLNLTKIESRPRREQLGHYMFFADLQGSVSETAVAEAIAGLRTLCHEVRVLGSYPSA